MQGRYSSHCTSLSLSHATDRQSLAITTISALACDIHRMVYSFTPEELSKYDGVKDKKIYFSVRGTVYDVSKAPDFYGPGMLIPATRSRFHRPDFEPQGCSA